MTILAQQLVDKLLRDKNCELISSERFVLMAIAERLSSSESCFPSQKFLQQYCDLSRCTVIRAIKELVNMKYLCVIRTVHATGVSNTYTLGEYFAVDNSVHEGGGSLTVRLGVVSPRDMEYINNKQSKNKAISCSDQNSVSEHFEAFWNLYPRKKARVKCMSVWRTKKLDKLAEVIIADVEKRKGTDWLAKDPFFIPLPLTYLNQERWQDDHDAPMPKHIQDIHIRAPHIKTEIRSTVPWYKPEPDPQPKSPKVEIDPDEDIKF